jgi:hypothetical protein
VAGSPSFASDRLVSCQTSRQPIVKLATAQRTVSCVWCLGATQSTGLSVFSRAFKEMHDMRVRLVEAIAFEFLNTLTDLDSVDRPGPCSMQLGWWLRVEGRVCELIISHLFVAGAKEIQ